MVMEAQKMPPTEFDSWVMRPENVEKNYELVLGECVEVVSNSKSSNIGSIIGGFISVHVVTHDLGHTTGADGGYQVGDERYIPDVGFVSKERMPILEDSAYISIAPDLAVEVISPTDSERTLMVKVANYLAEGTVVWVVYPEEASVDIYRRDVAVQRLGKNDVLKDNTLLPNFALPLKTVFK